MSVNIKRKQKVNTAIPTASMPDIIFMLLLFFMVATTMNVDKGLKQILPPIQADQKKIPKENLTNILIDPSGNILIDEEVVSVSQMYGVIKEKLKNINMVFSVQTTRRTNYNIYIKVLDKLKEAGAQKISISEPVDV